MKFKVAIVTPIHNRRDITLQCLRSLERIGSNALDISVYIVDDGSTDGSSEAIKTEHPNVEVIQGNGDLWYTEGTNVGIRAALGNDPDFILAINDDSVFDSEFLHYLVETANDNPRSVIGPLLLLWDQPHKLFQTAPVWKTLAGGWMHWNQQTVWTVPSTSWEVDLIVGNCVLYPASVFEECGFMDSRRFPNFGDAEFTPRLKSAGYRLIVDPRSRVFCQPNATPGRLRDKNLLQLVKDLVLDRRHPSNLTRIFLSHVVGGPSVVKGVAAWLVFVGNTARNAFRSDPANKERPEPPLSEVFAPYVLNRK
ncbi:MAG: glycosyltransferase family 2 protein [Pyrinomonadaceae bacterium]